MMKQSTRFSRSLMPPHKLGADDSWYTDEEAVVDSMSPADLERVAQRTSTPPAATPSSSRVDTAPATRTSSSRSLPEFSPSASTNSSMIAVGIGAVVLGILAVLFYQK